MKPQAQSILAYLQQQERWVCGTEFARDHGFTVRRQWERDAGDWITIPDREPPVLAYSQRIGELRRAGHRIESRRCRQHGHNVYEYRLVTK